MLLCNCSHKWIVKIMMELWIEFVFCGICYRSKNIWNTEAKSIRVQNHTAPHWLLLYGKDRDLLQKTLTRKRKTYRMMAKIVTFGLTISLNLWNLVCFTQIKLRLQHFHHNVFVYIHLNCYRYLRSFLLRIHQ